ncbi:MAG TPA: hypothetical protein VHU23_14310 [Rhizomicrobium sp.]|jgi:hypothetical protein|nr:hypothetical protein [Rhizomicrobium sp.]
MLVEMCAKSGTPATAIFYSLTTFGGCTGLRQRVRLRTNLSLARNFVKISGVHWMTPAQAAGVHSRLWEVSDMVAMIEEWEAANVG